MAKVAQMPAMDVVKSLRGVLDFYRWCEMTIVRSWPRKPSHPRSLYSVAASEKFTYINAQASVVDPEIKPFYTLLADASKFTWKDWQNSLWYRGVDRLHLDPLDDDY